MKNIGKIILLFLICSFTCAYAEGEKRITPEYDGNVITLSMDNAGKSGDILTVTVVKKGESISFDNAFAIDEVAVDEYDVAGVTYEMPEKYMNADNSEVFADGEYVLYVKNEKSTIVEYEFSFVSQSKRTEALELLAEGDASKVSEMMKPESEYRKALEAVGIDFEIYDQLSESAKAYVCNDFAKSANTVAESVSKISKIIAVKALNENSSSIELVMKSINPEFEDEKYNDITDDDKVSFINSYIKSNVDEITLDSIASFYENANILFIFNHLRFNEIEDSLEKYEDVLNISSNKKYSDYKKAKSSFKDKVDEELVRILKKNPVAEISSLVSEFENAYDKVKKDSGNGSSSGSGSGGGGGGISMGSSNKTASATVSVIQDNSRYDVFYDMKDAEWAREAVVALHEAGIVSGINENEFMPNKDVTREEFVAMLARVKKLELTEVDVFADVPQGVWYAPFVGAAHKAGIVNGISENEFGVGGLLTRQDMFAMMYRILDDIGNATRSIDEIEDFDDTSSYAKEAVKKLYESGLVSGSGNGKLEPLANTTRAEAAVMIYRLFMGA